MQIIKEPSRLQLTYEEFRNRGSTISGLKIGPYSIGRPIGEGGFGSVFVGQHMDTGVKVAIKLLDLQRVSMQKSPKIRAIREKLCSTESQMMQACDSEHLAKCYEVYQNNSLKIMIMEYCNGISLQREIKQRQHGMPEEEAIVILKQIINGVAEMHRHKIIHRDLKAENIMSHNGIYKITDFGFSKQLDITYWTEELVNTSLGTITTMAPEVLNRKPYGLKADIWSIGIIFFQMIFGTWPYTSIRASEMYEEIKKKRYFTTPELSRFNGKRASDKVAKFLRQTMVVESVARLDWQGVEQHEIFQRSSERMMPVFRVDTEFNIPHIEKSEYAEKEDFMGNIELKNNNEKDKKEEVPIEKQPTPIKQKPMDDKPLLKPEDQLDLDLPKPKVELPADIPSVELAQNNMSSKKEEPKQYIPNHQQNKKPEIKPVLKQEKLKVESEQRERKPPQTTFTHQNSHPKRSIQSNTQQNLKQDYELYLWSQKAHLQCLKTEHILKEIVQPIQNYRLVPLDSRKGVQLMYLLLTRCHNNMSPINEKYERHKDSKSVRSLFEQIKPLYGRVYLKWIAYCSSLTEQENHKTEMLKDFFTKRIWKAENDMKDKFLTGIEGIDYSKEDQIKYTYSAYIATVMNDLQGSGTVVKSVQAQLQKYKQICNLMQEQILYSSFPERIRALVFR